jgi:hypothetical protein
VSVVSAEEQAIQINVPPEELLGRYANMLTVWHTPHEFTLDFSTVNPHGGSLQAQVVARIRIAPTLVFDIMRALNDHMTRYEAVFGEIKRLAVEPPHQDADNEGADDDGDD